MNTVRTVILDTSAILHSRDLRPLMAMGRLVTTNYVINELKDVRAAVVPAVLNIDVYDVSAKEVALARRNHHLPKLLSDTDVSLIILAMRFRDEKPVVITDDSLLIKFLRKLGIEYLVVFLRKY